jgi:hypothetical protein
MRPLNPTHVVVLGGCGHWWAEGQPPGFRMTSQPRVCMNCQPNSPGSVGPSPQGFGMVPVKYLTDWTEHEVEN